MVFDPIDHEKKRKIYLECLVNAEEDFQMKNPGVTGVINAVNEGEMARVTGWKRSLVERLSSELRDKGMIEFQGFTDRETGSSHSLTNQGREVSEVQRYDESFLAKQRKFIEFVKDGGIYLSKKALILFVGLIGSLIGSLGVFFSIQRENFGMDQDPSVKR